MAATQALATAPSKLGIAAEKDILRALSKALARQAKPETKKWFENYLKGAVPYYGVKTPHVRRIVVAWRAKWKLHEWPPQRQLNLVCQLISLPHAEEKFAGALYIQMHLVRALPADDLLDAAEKMFQRNAFGDWSSSDWFSVRALAEVVRADRRAAARIAGWTTADDLWQKRAAAVALRPVVRDRDSLPLVRRVAAALVGDPRRFIQTGIGWLISDLSKEFPDEAARIVERHFANMSKEAIDRHTRRLPRHLEYRRRKRAA